jgi:hypothetical protein
MPQPEKRGFIVFTRDLSGQARMLFGYTNTLATVARNMAPMIAETKAMFKGKAPDQDMDNHYDDCILSDSLED